MKQVAWSLFSNDLIQAEQTLQALSNTLLSNQDAADLYQALTFFGHFEQAQELLICAEPSIRLLDHAKAALLRIRQYREHSNPWLSLCQAEQKPWFETINERFKDESQTLQVFLGGGLGDILEILASLSASPQGLRARTTMIIPRQAQKALQPLLERDQAKHQLLWSDHAIKDRRDSIDLPMMVFKAVLAANKKHQAPKPIISAKEQARGHRTLLCCWRSKVDPNEKLWAHLRSMNMNTIVDLYQQLIPITRQRGINIVDITYYKQRETSELLGRYPQGLTLAAGQIKSFVDTTKFLGQNTIIASIDTSLVHLACWCDQNPLILAHRWPDGRWIKGSWSNVTILEQNNLFDWSAPIKELIKKIQNHPFV